MDIDWANRMLDLEEQGKETPPVGEDIEFSPLGYTDVVSRLDLIADRTMSVRTAVQASYADKHQEPHFEPMRRPATAMQRERERRARKVLLTIDAQLFGEGLAM